MRLPRNQVFLERRSYRMRRMGDAARLLPVIGLVLLLLPLFWAPETAGSPRMTAWDGVFLFAVWVGLIALAALLSRKLTRMAELPVQTESRAAPLFDDQGTGE